MKTQPTTDYITRDAIVKLLSDVEIASVGTAETAPRLVEAVRMPAPEPKVQPTCDHLRRNTEVATATPTALRWDASATATATARSCIALRPDRVTVSEVNEKVEAALQRQARTDAESIHVEAAGGKVTLSGRGLSLRTMHNARAAAWTVVGVSEVVDAMVGCLESAAPLPLVATGHHQSGS